MRRLLALFIIFVPVIGATAAAPQDDQKTVTCPELIYKQGHFRSGGETIEIEEYRPKTKGKLPVVIMVHGAGGVFSRESASDIPEMDNFGEKQLACNGFIVLLPHYLDSTGQVSALNRDDIARKGSRWLDTLLDAVAYAIKLKRSEGRKVFLFGESLGGYLSVALAARDPRIKAVSVFGAGKPPGVTFDRMPPVLIQHGEDDDVVPVTEALKLRAELQRNGGSILMKTYPRVGHYPNSEVQRNIAEAAVAFFLLVSECEVIHKGR